MTGTDVGHQWDHLANGFAVERSVGHLRTDIAVQTDQVEQRLIQYPLDRASGIPVDERHVRRDSHLNGLGLADTSSQKSDLRGAVHDDSSDPDVCGPAQLAGSCGVAMHHDLVRDHTRDKRGRELATRVHAKTSSLLRDPLRDGSAQERLAGIDQANLGESGAVSPNPMTKVGLVDDVGRGAELIGDFG